MVVVNPELLYNTDSELHLRDARHAHNFYVQHSHSFTPKVKFLYHVVFDLKDSYVRNKAPNTDEFKKQIAVMAKTVDLPSFKSQINIKQQYNRKKNVQTRIDYNEINMTFHDDNVGVTRAMLEEYYRYYFRDGNKNNGSGFPVGFDPRDLYKNMSHKYGLDNIDARSPFFGFIKIYQLSRQKWHSYTLINPILTSWKHDTLDYSVSQTMENSMSVAYEGVLYNFGDISDNGEPAGFTDQETGYDQIHSPLDTQENAYNQSLSGSNAEKFDPKLNQESENTNSTFSNIIKKASESKVFIDQLDTEFEKTGIEQILFPYTDIQNITTISNNLQSGRINNFNSDKITRELTNDSELLDSVIARVLGTSALSVSQTSSNLDITNLSENEREIISQEIFNSINQNNKKVIQIANIALQNKNLRNRGII